MKPERRLLRLAATLLVALALLTFHARRVASSATSDSPSNAALPVPRRSPPEAPGYPSTDLTATAAATIPASASAEQARLHATIRDGLKRWHETHTGQTAFQETIIEKLLALLTDENTAEILQTLSPSEFDTPFGSKALGRWLDLDFASASRWIAAHPGATSEHAHLVAIRLIQKPERLIAFLDETGFVPGWRDTVLHHASLEAIPHDTRGALAAAARISPGAARVDAFETIAYAWFGRDAVAAHAWALAEPDPRLRERLLAVGAKAIAITDPDLAIHWLNSSEQSEALRAETTLSVVDLWAARHPSPAAAWVSALEPGSDLRRSALQAVYLQWAQSDQASADAWLNALPDHASVRAALSVDDHRPEPPRPRP